MEYFLVFVVYWKFYYDNFELFSTTLFVFSVHCIDFVYGEFVASEFFSVVLSVYTFWYVFDDNFYNFFFINIFAIVFLLVVVKYLCDFSVVVWY